MNPTEFHDVQLEGTRFSPDMVCLKLLCAVKKKILKRKIISSHSNVKETYRPWVRIRVLLRKILQKKRRKSIPQWLVKLENVKQHYNVFFPLWMANCSTIVFKIIMWSDCWEVGLVHACQNLHNDIACHRNVDTILHYVLNRTQITLYLSLLLPCTCN